MSKMHSLTSGALALAVLVLAASVFAHGASNAQPADKMAVAGSGLAIAGPGEEITILSGSMKTSSPTDAVVTVSLECDILTQVTTIGNGDERAFGQVKVWVEIDGAILPVASDDADDTGKVVFCDRAHQQTTNGFDTPLEQDDSITTYLSTRSANSFQWVALNMGSATHDIVVKATLTETASNHAVAHAAIGKRTITVDPVKLANNAVI